MCVPKDVEVSSTAPEVYGSVSEKCTRKKIWRLKNTGGLTGSLRVTIIVLLLCSFIAHGSRDPEGEKLRLKTNAGLVISTSGLLK